MQRRGISVKLAGIALFAFLLCGCKSVHVGVNPAQQALDEWRNLSLSAEESPRVFVRGDNLRFYFQGTNGVEVFTANWGRVRVPTPGYEVNSAILRWNQRVPRVPRPESHWREATVISGREWRRLSTNLVAALAPEKPGSGAYYQAFLADGLVYRDALGVPRFTALGRQPPGIRVEARYAADETLLILAERLEKTLAQTHPDQTLFLLMAPSASRVTHPLLLDRQRRLCVSLTPAAVVDLAERGLSGLVTGQGLSAALFEGHGLALVKNPVSSVARLADLAAQSALRFLYLRLPKPKGEIPPVTSSSGMDLASWESWLDHYTGTKREQGSMELLLDGPAFFRRFERAIEEATNHINLRVFIFDKDDVAVGIADQLKRRSQTVDVRVIFDRLGSIAAGGVPPATPLPENFVPPSSIYSYLREGSRVKVRPFLNPWFSTDHSKVLLIDGARAWLGGMNIGREYLYEWHDMMVEVRGPVVQTLEKDFRRSWAHEGPLGDLGYLGALLSESEAHSPAPGTNSWSEVRLLPTCTAWKPFSAAVQAALRKSRSYVYLENPYLFDKRTILALVHARQRGVDVRVVLPRDNDFKAGGRGNLVIANYLLGHGVRVFFYPGMTHAKALLVDGWSCVGSGNLNHLSLRVNQEENIATSDRQFAECLKRELFERDFERAFELKHPVSVDWVDFLTDLLIEGF